jgi:hypothetical protein
VALEMPPSPSVALDRSDPRGPPAQAFIAESSHVHQFRLPGQGTAERENTRERRKCAKGIPGEKSRVDEIMLSRKKEGRAIRKCMVAGDCWIGFVKLAELSDCLTSYNIPRCASME